MSFSSKQMSWLQIHALGSPQSWTGMLLASLLLGLPLLNYASAVAQEPVQSTLTKPRSVPVDAFTIEGELRQTSERLEVDDSYYQVHPFEGIAGQEITIDLVSLEFDTYLHLIDPMGRKVAENNDGGEMNNARIIITLSTTGTYQILVNTYEANQVGHYRLSLRATTTEDLTLQEAAQLSQQALELGRQGQYGEAVLLTQQALAIRQQAFGDNHPNVAISLNNLALLYQDQGNYAQAEPLYQQALTIFKQALGDNHPNMAASLNALALLYQDQGNYAQAEPLYQQALAISKQALGDNHPDVATSLNNLAGLYKDQGNYTQAEPLYQQALAIRQQALGDNHPTVATSLNNLALLYWAQGNSNRALEFLRQGSEVEEINLASNLSLGSETRKQAYLATLSGATDVIISLHLQAVTNNHKAASLALTTVLRRKGRVLEAMTAAMQRLRQNLTPTDQQLLDQLVAQQTQLATLFSRGLGNQTPEQYRAEIDQLTQSINQLENTLAQRSAEFRVETQPVSIAAVQALIPSNAVLVELVRYRPFNPRAATPDERWGVARYAAYLLHAQGEIRWVDLGEAAPIDALIQQFRTAAQTEAYLLDRQGNIPRQLDALLMQPIRPLLGNATHLLISPDSQLNQLPFAALLDEQQRYLLETYTITYLSSGRDLLRLQTEVASQQPPFIFAHPDYGGQPQTMASANNTSQHGNQRSRDSDNLQFNDLPYTQTEAETIAPLLPSATVLTDAQATVSALKQLQAPSILHIATHGFFLPDAETESGTPLQENPLLRSGLALAGANLPSASEVSGSAQEDGLLTALEASSLNLRGTNLVVLSACETGLGDIRNGEGVYGLRRAIVLAGAESQVMSLWGVGDESTSYLMALYYQNLNQGMGRSEALRQAQLSLLRDTEHAGWALPKHWAAFTFSGDWNPL
jgi:CHAT domain-containing protein